MNENELFRFGCLLHFTFPLPAHLSSNDVFTDIPITNFFTNELTHSHQLPISSPILGDDILSIANKKIRWEFVFEDKENLHNWLIHLIQHAQDHRRWKQAAEQRMLVYSPQNVTVQRRPFKRTRSKLVMLYNDIDHS